MTQAWLHSSMVISLPLGRFLPLAKQGNADAQYGIALIAMKQDPPDYVSAVPWLEKGARGGNANAQYFLGLLHNQGVGVEFSEPLATYWFQQAAAQGHPDATAIIVQESVHKEATVGRQSQTKTPATSSNQAQPSASARPAPVTEGILQMKARLAGSGTLS